MTRLVKYSLAAMALLLALCASAQADDETWKAGAARVDITPQKPMWMSGYSSRDKPAEGKLHDLWAKALVLEDPAGARIVLVTLDLVGIHRDLSQKICRQLQEKHGLDRSAIALCCSHTHTGPVVGENLASMYLLEPEQQQLIREYAEQLETNVQQAVAGALENLAPARLKWGRGQATFAVNRRNNQEKEVPALRSTGLLNGPVDYDVPVLSVRDAEGKLRAVVCGYACHATTLAFFQWSGDWPGFAQIELEKAHPGAIALFWAGCGADQNPLPRRSVELAEEYGRQLAAAVNRVLAGVMPPVEGRLSAKYAEIDLPFAQLPGREQLESEQNSSDRYVASRAKLLLSQWDRDGQLSPSYPYPIQSWRLGSGPQWVLLGGEVVVDYSLRLKAELSEPAAWVAGYANDVMAYIPSRRVLVEGGYEGGGAMVYYGLPSPWSPDVEELIINEVRRQAQNAQSE